MQLTTPIIILIVAVAVFAVGSLIYGLVRKFSQMGWAAWQLLFAWCLTMTLDWLPEELAPAPRAAISLAVFFIAVLGTLALGGLIRLAMLKKMRPAHGFFRFLDRVLGAVTAFLDYFMIAVVPGLLVLSFLSYAITPLESLQPLFAMGIWTNFIGKFGLDLVLVAVFFFAMRCGWRVGFARTFVIFLMFALSLGVVGLSLYLCIAVPPFAALAHKIGGAIRGIDTAVANVIGYGAVFLMIFAVLFTLECILGHFLVKLLRHIRFHYFWGFLDGILGLALALAIALLCTIAFYAVCAALSDGAIYDQILQFLHNLGIEQFGGAVIEGAIETIAEYTQGLRTWLASSPVSRGLLHFF